LLVETAADLLHRAQFRWHYPCSCTLLVRVCRRGAEATLQCLVKAAPTNEDDHPTITSLHKATYGILLFATPHKGLVVDDMHKMIAGHGNHPRNALLQQIRHKSDMLVAQLADFKNLIRDRKVVSFYETEQTRQLVFVRHHCTEEGPRR
jgi:hypothetical protein